MIRALHLSLTVGTTAVSTATIKSFIDLASQYRFNTIVLFREMAIRLDSLPSVYYATGAWTKAEFIDVIAYIKARGMSYVFNIAALTHQNVFFSRGDKRYMKNSTLEYNPRRPEVQQIMFNVINEIVALSNPMAIHIGHDEVSETDTENLQPELYVESVQMLRNHIKSHNIETWMWGDMLIAPSEFPSESTAYCRGDFLNYYTYRSQIPPDIVICDWHYTYTGAVYDSTVIFRAEGRQVIGATWDNNVGTKNFIRYAKSVGIRGMMCTIWAYVLTDIPRANGIIRSFDGAFIT